MKLKLVHRGPRVKKKLAVGSMSARNMTHSNSEMSDGFGGKSSKMIRPFLFKFNCNALSPTISNLLLNKEQQLPYRKARYIETKTKD